MSELGQASDQDSPFHPGERAVQERLGVRERVDRNALRMVRDYMPDEHRDFFSLLPFVVVGSLDAHARPWASLVCGQPGFVRSPHPRSLIIGSAPLPGDPLAANLFVGAPLGVLGIQLETQRRNRENGRLLWHSASGFELHVEQSFGNCKKYIQMRTPLHARRSSPFRDTPSQGGTQLNARCLQILQACDTAFLATASADPARGGAEGVDVSHRGGLPGFLNAEAIATCTRITLPDYSGNNMFNSLGNIAVRPRAGLIACDFASGDLLSVSGLARVVWEGVQIAQFPDAQRLLQLDVQQHVLLPGALPQAWSHPTFAAQLVQPPRS